MTKEEKAQQQKEYYQKNRERISDYKKEYYQKNKERINSRRRTPERKSYERDYAQAHLEARRTIIQRYKAAGCAFCDEKEPVSLDFHHIDPRVKDDSIGRIKGLERMVNEIEKCMVVCSNCHRKIHAGLIEVLIDTTSE